MNNRALHIIMPMAGEGSRFRNEGWYTPKPLITVNNVPMFKHAIDSINTDGLIVKYSFIVRQNHIDEFNIDKHINTFFPDANICVVNKTTRGAVETCMIAQQHITDDDAILVMDCDLNFNSKQFDDTIRRAIANNDIDGVLVSFNSNLPKYSYAEIDDNNNVIRTAEKQVISNHALCGAYFFGTGKLFKHIASILLLETALEASEYYVSLLYNYVIKMGRTVKLTKIDDYYSYGTPEELKQYS